MINNNISNNNFDNSFNEEEDDNFNFIDENEEQIFNNLERIKEIQKDLPENINVLNNSALTKLTKSWQASKNNQYVEYQANLYYNIVNVRKFINYNESFIKVYTNSIYKLVHPSLQLFYGIIIEFNNDNYNQLSKDNKNTTNIEFLLNNNSNNLQLNQIVNKDNVINSNVISMSSDNNQNLNLNINKSLQNISNNSLNAKEEAFKTSLSNYNLNSSTSNIYNDANLSIVLENPKGVCLNNIFCVQEKTLSIEETMNSYFLIIKLLNEAIMFMHNSKYPHLYINGKTIFVDYELFINKNTRDKIIKSRDQYLLNNLIKVTEVGMFSSFKYNCLTYDNIDFYEELFMHPMFVMLLINSSSKNKIECNYDYYNKFNTKDLKNSNSITDYVYYDIWSFLSLIIEVISSIKHIELFNISEYKSNIDMFLKQYSLESCTINPNFNFNKELFYYLKKDLINSAKQNLKKLYNDDSIIDNIIESGFSNNQDNNMKCILLLIENYMSINLYKESNNTSTNNTTNNSIENKEESKLKNNNLTDYEIKKFVDQKEANYLIEESVRLEEELANIEKKLSMLLIENEKRRSTLKFTNSMFKKNNNFNIINANLNKNVFFFICNDLSLISCQYINSVLIDKCNNNVKSSNINKDNKQLNNNHNYVKFISSFKDVLNKQYNTKQNMFDKTLILSILKSYLIVDGCCVYYSIQNNLLIISGGCIIFKKYSVPEDNNLKNIKLKNLSINKDIVLKLDFQCYKSNKNDFTLGNKEIVNNFNEQNNANINTEKEVNIPNNINIFNNNDLNIDDINTLTFSKQLSEPYNINKNIFENNLNLKGKVQKNKFNFEKDVIGQYEQNDTNSTPKRTIEQLFKVKTNNFIDNSNELLKSKINQNIEKYSIVCDKEQYSKNNNIYINPLLLKRKNNICLISKNITSNIKDAFSFKEYNSIQYDINNSDNISSKEENQDNTLINTSKEKSNLELSNIILSSMFNTTKSEKSINDNKNIINNKTNKNIVNNNILDKNSELSINSLFYNTNINGLIKRSNHSIIEFQNYIFIIGGDQDKTCEFFNLSTHSCKFFYELNEFRVKPALFFINNIMFCFDFESLIKMKINLENSENAKKGNKLILICLNLT